MEKLRRMLRFQMQMLKVALKLLLIVLFIDCRVFWVSFVVALLAISFTLIIGLAVFY